MVYLHVMTSFAFDIMSLHAVSETTEKKLDHWDLIQFESIYQRWNILLQRYANYYLKDEEASQSIVNDLFVHLWFNKKEPDNLKGYLFKAVKNASLNFLTRQKRIPVEYMDESDLTLVSDLSAIERTEIYESDKLLFLQKVIEMLPERRQLVFKLFRIEGFSYAEIAELMQISVRTVEDHLAKSMQFIHSKAKHLVDENLTEA